MGKIYKFLGRLFSNDYITAGPDNEVNNNECTVIGSNLVTGGDHQTILGKYNEKLDGDYCLIIGQGTSNKRKNILTLADNGNLAIPGTISAAGYKNFPKVVQDISFVDNTFTVIYTDGTSKSGTIGPREKATGIVTKIYTNAETIYYITIDTELSSLYTYSIDNSTNNWWISGGDESVDNAHTPDEEDALREMTLNLKSTYSFCITDVNGHITTIDVSSGDSGPEPYQDFKFMYTNGKISWL